MWAAMTAAAGTISATGSSTRLTISGGFGRFYMPIRITDCGSHIEVPAMGAADRRRGGDAFILEQYLWKLLEQVPLIPKLVCRYSAMIFPVPAAGQSRYLAFLRLQQLRPVSGAADPLVRQVRPGGLRLEPDIFAPIDIGMSVSVYQCGRINLGV
jgi:hypothetical protein